MHRYLFFSLTICFVAAAVVGCQSNVKAPFNGDPQSLLVNTNFTGETHEPESTVEIFALPDSIKQQLKKVSNPHHDTSRKAKAIISFILTYADNGLLYDNSSTLIAAETVANGRANCLSLSILAYSMATELGLDAVFQDVQIPEYWTSDSNQSWLNGHVNVRLLQKDISDNTFGLTLLGKDIVVDFDPFSSKQNFPARLISRDRVIAMFYNNKAAQAFSEKNYAQAFAYYEAAATIDPNFAVTWSNIGILYRIHGMYRLAEQSYNLSLHLDPDSMNTLSNLAFLYQKTGRKKEANQLERQVLAKRNSNPYYYLMLGNEAFKRSDMKEAISQFNRSLQLERRNHEAYFGLAKTYYALQDTARVSLYLEKALRAASSAHEQQRYQHKLAILNQVAAAH